METEKMKAVLFVGEMPERCSDCYLFETVENELGAYKICIPWGHRELESFPEKPDWCPLKPLPRYGALGSVITADGYTLSTASELLEEIVGDEE